jgi:phage head maturation protease
LDKKLFNLLEYKAEQTEEGFYISGYANTKGNEDAYGDIPMGDKVYDLSRFKKNPVALVDHENSVGNIFGVFVLGEGATQEDEKGLRIKLRLMDNPQTDIAKHAVEAYKSGFARAFSIGGKWFFDDKANPKHLTKAFIHEISGVAIGADAHALSTTSKPKSLAEITEAERRQLVIEGLISEYRKSNSNAVLETIQILRSSK